MAALCRCRRTWLPIAAPARSLCGGFTESIAADCFSVNHVTLCETSVNSIESERGRSAKTGDRGRPKPWGTAGKEVPVSHASAMESAQATIVRWNVAKPRRDPARRVASFGTRPRGRWPEPRRPASSALRAGGGAFAQAGATRAWTSSRCTWVAQARDTPSALALTPQGVPSALRSAKFSGQACAALAEMRRGAAMERTGRATTPSTTRAKIPS